MKEKRCLWGIRESGDTFFPLQISVVPDVLLHYFDVKKNV